MALMIEVSAELEAFLRDEAAKAGITLHEHIIQIIIERLNELCRRRV